MAENTDFGVRLSGVNSLVLPLTRFPSKKDIISAYFICLIESLNTKSKMNF